MIGTNFDFQARLVVRDGKIETLEVFTWELAPLVPGRRSVREWVEDHIRNVIPLEDFCEDVANRGQPGRKKVEIRYDHGEILFFEAVFEGKAASWQAGPDGEWDESVDVVRSLCRSCMEEDSSMLPQFLDEPWRTMKDAPRDGTEVLLKVEYRAGDPGKCLVGHWMPGGYCIDDHPPIDEGWYFWNGCMFDKASKPVAWCPLPEVKGNGYG